MSEDEQAERKRDGAKPESAKSDKAKARERVIRQQREAIRGAGLFLLLVPVLVVLLFAVMWPWPARFSSELPEGPAAARDAYRLCWNAQRLIDGRALPDWSTPMLYPQAGTLAFAEPLYVPAFVAALPYYATGSAALTYNFTLLVFWVLSGLGMYLFLRELGVGRLACTVGAIAFVLLPFRTARPGELPLQLCAGVPFCLMFVTRWIRTQQRRWALLVALVFGAQALTVFGYALALAFAVPIVVVVGIVRRRPSPFYDRQFYDGIAIMALLPLVIVAVFLWPAMDYRKSDAYLGKIEALGPGGASPLAYLNPDEGSLVHVVTLGADKQATRLFPGVAVFLLALAYAYFQRQSLRKLPATVGRSRRVRQIIINVLAVTRIALGVLVVIVFVASAVASDEEGRPSAGRLVGPALIAILAVSFLLTLVSWRRPRAFGTALMHGAGLAALACFIWSLGPEIVPAAQASALCQSPLPQPGALDLFVSTIRPATRFAIVPIVFLVAAAAWILDELAHHRRFRWLPIPVLVLVCAESIVLPHRFQPDPSTDELPFVKHVPLAPGELTLFALPGGDAEADTRWLLSTVGRFDLLVNGASAVTPSSYRELGEALDRGDLEGASAMVQEVWPKPYLLVDRKALREHERAFALDAQRMEREWWSVFDDGRYVLYEPAVEESAPLVVRKRLRTDYARTHRLLRFSARVKFSDPELEPYVVVRWNGQGDQSFALTSAFEPLEFDALERWVGRPEGDIVTISLVLKVNDEFVPAEEALAQREIDDAWEVVDIKFFKVARR